MQKLILALTLLIANLLFSQDFKKKAKYLDSIVSKADTVFLIFTKEINFIQSEVPIYDFQIEKSKLNHHGNIDYDTLSNGILTYKNLPNEKRSNLNFKNYSHIESAGPLLFENDEFKKYNENYWNKKVIGYEKRTCVNDDNRILQNRCSDDSFYKYIFYHSYVKSEFQKKYQDYIRNRDSKFKKYEVRYSGRSPNLESGAIGFTEIRTLSISGNNLLFFIDSYYENIIGRQNRRITLPYLSSILKPDKVYYLKTNYSSNGNEDIFEEVKYQKYSID